MCERVTGRLAKDGTPCPVCGGDVPPSPNRRQRKYCSRRCCYNRPRAGRAGPKPSEIPCLVCARPIAQDPSSHGARRICSKACAFLRKRQLRGGKPQQIPCVVCGVGIKQDLHRGRTKRICSRECERKRDSARKPKEKEGLCVSCGAVFLSKYQRQFCSKRCQHGGRGEVHGDFVSCEACGKPFRQSCREKRFCSRKCFKPAKEYTCLNCGKQFCRKRYKSGAYSIQTKYCTRECAFEARRLKKPCAQRPKEIAGRLARWFLSWGDDQWPLTSKCRVCGDIFTAQAHAGADRFDACYSCRRRIATICKNCVDCGCELTPGILRRCDPCRQKRRKEIRRAEKRRRRKAGGGEGSYRQRCKKYGAPYTKVSRKAVLDRDRWKCQLCGNALLRSHTTLFGTRTPHPRSPTLDHIVPLSFGPTSPGHVFDNCQAACWGCNCERGVEDADSFARRKATPPYY